MAARLTTQRLLTASTTLPALRHTMASSSTTPRTYDFLVILPDKPDALQRRLDARA